MLQGFSEAITHMEKVREWDFNLDDPGFQWYLKARGLGDHIFRPESDIGRILRQYRSADEITAAGEDIPRYLVVARARLQDAWEMYCEPGAHEIMELWGGYKNWKQPGAAKIDGLGTRLLAQLEKQETMAQQLLADLEEWGIKVERHGESVDVVGGNWPEGKRKEWKRRFNECWREFIALLPDCNSLMQAPEGFTEVSPGNFAHQDDLPTVRAMMALAGIGAEVETKPTAAPRPAWQAPAFRVIPKWCLPAFEIHLNPQAGPQPNEHGAFVPESCECPWSYTAKRLKARILLVCYQGAWYSSFEISGADWASQGFPSINCYKFKTKIEAIDKSANHIISEAGWRNKRNPDKGLQNLIADLNGFLYTLRPEMKKGQLDLFGFEL